MYLSLSLSYVFHILWINSQLYYIRLISMYTLLILVVNDIILAHINHNIYLSL